MDWGQHALINNLCAEFFSGNIKHLSSFLILGRCTSIFPNGRQCTVYYTYATPRLMKSWLQNGLGHQQLWCWPSFLGIFSSLHQNVQNISEACVWIIVACSSNYMPRQSIQCVTKSFLSKPNTQTELSYKSPAWLFGLCTKMLRMGMTSSKVGNMVIDLHMIFQRKANQLCHC